MATRRNVASDVSAERLVSPAQGGPASDSITSDTRPAVPADVIIKLLAFTFAMIVMPIGSYFFTLRFVFNGNSIYSGGFAAVMANVVLVAYIIVAMREDASDELNTGATGVDVLKRKVERQSKKSD